MSSENTFNKEIALKAGRRLARCKPGEEVVISGIAGVFPDSADVRHLGENLLNKVDLISDDDRRWKLEHPEIPQRTGKLLVVNKFDAAFFGVHYKQAQTMDPMSRMLLEKSYEAIVDAGYNPKHLRGTKTGVFIGACFSESEKTWFYEKIQINGFGITGCSRAMLANRISYWLGINGPSYTVDSACSSSLYALEHAYRSIRDGFCDQALVGGCNLCLHPYVSLQFARLGVLSPDGRCKCFDDAANGYCRSETICVAFLQKSKDARRIYARVVHAKTNCDGYKEQGITYPSGLMQRKLLTDFYEECEIDPSTLDYVEAHGTGTRVGDPEEVKALDAVFCPGRKGPLKIGSVKSNIGHSEPASGLCSVSKVIVAMETGLIPPNINLKTLRKDVEAFQEGRITVITEPTPWNGGLVGVNSFGFGGANCHVLLSSHKKEKINKGLPADDIPRLVCVSGRTEEAVDVMLKELEANPIDVEYIRLFHEVYSDEISGHVYRAYTLLKQDNSKPVKSVEYYPGFKRPIWFVFAGMGSQWPSMGKSLMNIPLFAKSINKSHQLLKSKGLDLIKIITTSDPNIFDNILHSFVGIAAIQIGLVDILNELEIVPDGIVGHSVGELGCSYADGCFTAEQTLLAAYYRGLASVETEFIHGSMASIGLGYNAVKDEVPSDIDVACHNGPDSCTLSGPTESITKYVEILQKRGIFARRVNVSNIAYHSRYIAHAAPKLLKYLTEIIPKPKERSSRWISSSVLEENWNTERAKYSSAEYHTNNLLSSVYFEEASKKIPPKSVVIEIAPHGLLQAILKRSLPKDVVNIPLTLRSADNAEFLLIALGKAYLTGLNCKLHKIYPTVEFPVSRGTPMIAPLIRWEHGEDWHVTSYKMQEKIKSGERTVVVSLKDDELEYLAGHVIDGRNLYPATGYLLLAWETISMMRGELYSEVPIVFENVRFNRATNIPKEGEVEFTIMVQKGSGNFEVIEGGAPVVSGRLYVPQDINKEMVNVPDLEELLHDEPETLPLTDKDIYKELRLRGYNYKGYFKGLTRANNSGSIGYVLWLNNFVAFMDNMLQMQILNEDTRSLFVPTSISKLVINTKKHFSLIQSLPSEKPELPVYVFKDIDLIRSGGIECRGLKASPIARKKPLGDPVLDKYVFVPQVSIKGLSFEEIFRVFINIALENVPSTKVKTIEYVDSSVKPDGTLASPVIFRALGDLPLIQADVVILGSNEHPLLTEIESEITVDDKKLPSDQSALIVSATQLLSRKELLTTALNSIKDGGFIVTRESTEEKLQPELHELIVCADYVLENERLLLLRKQPIASTINPIVIKIEADKYSWLPEVQKAVHSLVKQKNQKLIVYSEKEPLNGILGFYNALKKEPYTEDIRCFVITDEKAPAFNIEHPLYRTQLAKDLNVNVFKNGTWGSYRHLPLDVQSMVKTYHSYANTLIRGDLSSLKWVEGPVDPYDYELTDSEELIHVYYAPLNFRDIMLATGKLSAEVITRNRIEMECLQGFEYAGKTSSGKRYMGMVIAKTMASLIINDVHFAWEVPDEWTLEEAATVPCVYGTVIYSLITTARIRRGESILIHAGSGGVGQAAINICSYYGCEIFTTVGTPEKREFIRKTFPQIPESHIGNSRDTSFEQMVMKETNGKGVDIVLNSLAEEKLQASVRCLGYGGRFLEIGKFDLAKNNTLGMGFFLRETSFHGVMLDQLFKCERKVKHELVSEVTKAIKCGAVKPLVRTVFNYDEIETAFRHMAAGKHIGKVILKIRDEEEDKYSPPEVKKFDAVPRYLCHKKKSFIICGGLGGFGLELADWLVLRGARYLVLTSRSGVRTGYQSMRIRIWRSYGVKVIIALDDITKKEGIKKLLETANSLGPVAGIFNLAVVLQDATFENQTEESFAASAGPKAVATSYLDELSRVMCPQLEQFIVFSSVSCGHGNAGQTNYAMSNSVMEKICESRKADGLPATAIEWGAVGEVGLVAEMAEDNVDIVIGGTLQQRIASCLEVMDYLLKQPNAIVGSMVVAEKRSASSGSGTIVDTVVNILGLRDLKTVSLHSTLAELGMDSMMAVEIKQSLEREFEVFLTPQDIRSLTFAKLYEIAATVENESKDSNKDKVTENTIPEVGAHYFLRSVGDEATAGIPIVRVPSKLHNGSIEEVPINKAPTVFVIPSIEGNASIMEPLAANLEMQVLCVQYSYEDPKETIEEMAESILPHILSRLKPDEPFHLIGYSYGGVVGLEIARLLEKAGYKGEICLIDSSPEFLKNITKLIFYDETQSEDELQIRLLLHYISLIWPRVSSELKDDLYKVKSWNDRLDLLMSVAPEDGVRHSKRYQRLLMHAGLLRLKALFAKSEPKQDLILAAAALIRPTEISIKTSDDYELSQYFKTRVLTYFVEGNHFTILENKKTAEIISSIFKVETRAKFEKYIISDK